MTLVAAFLAVTNPRFQCWEKEGKLRAGGYTEEHIEMVRQSKHCSGISPVLKFQVEDIQFFRCPCAFMSPEFGFLLTLYRAYSDFGTLPYPGPTADQPAKVMEYFALADRLRKDLEEQQALEARRNNG